MNELIIFGCGGHARSIASVAIRSGMRVKCFYDESAGDNEKIFNISVLKPAYDCFSSAGIVGIGDNLKRSKCFKMYSDVDLVNVISKFADVSTSIKIGRGNFISSACYIGPNVSMSNNNIINTGAIIEHDVTIGSHSHVSIGSRLAGNVSVGNYCYLGAGTIVIDGINICDNVIIGAGSVVIRDISESGTYVGIPARRIK